MAVTFDYNVGDALKGFAGSALDNMFGSNNAKDARSHQEKMFGEQKIWQKRLMIYGPEWQVRGLKNAGLNPMLAVMGKHPSVPSVPSPAAQGGFYSPNFSSGAATAVQAQKVDAEVSKIDHEIDVVREQYNLTVQQTRRLRQEVYNLWQTNFLIQEQTKGQRIQNDRQEYLNRYIQSEEFRQFADDLGIGENVAKVILFKILGVGN
jgi:hypothetical protein